MVVSKSPSGSGTPTLGQFEQCIARPDDDERLPSSNDTASSSNGTTSNRLSLSSNFPNKMQFTENFKQNLFSMMLSSFRRRPIAVLGLILFLFLSGVTTTIWRWNDCGGDCVSPHVIQPSGPANDGVKVCCTSSKF